MMPTSSPGSSKGSGAAPEHVELFAHPPERQIRTEGALLCAGCGCCCCCCCCLHSLGGLAGALTVGPDIIQDQRGAPMSRIPSVDIQNRYWKTMGIVSLITMGVGFLFMGLVALIFAFPVVQLVGSLVVLISIQNLPPDERVRARWQLRRLTLRAFLGSLFGTFIMLGILLLYLYL